MEEVNAVNEFQTLGAATGNERELRLQRQIKGSC